MTILMVTGHRLQHLPCKFDHKHPWKLSKLKAIENFLTINPPAYVISGMAIGVDMWVAHVAVKLGIPLHAYIPFEGQERRWGDQFQQQYNRLLNNASEIKVICEGEYAPWKMYRRNEAMINNSNTVLTIWDSTKRYGGTWSTIAHAYNIGRPIFNLWGDKMEEVSLPKSQI